LYARFALLWRSSKLSEEEPEEEWEEEEWGEEETLEEEEW
jgi:hypothetical protein